MATPRNTATRDKHRATIAKDRPACGICGQPIDYTLPHRHLKSYVVDHVTPLDLGGTDTLDNKQAAHRDCNRAKSNSPAYRHPSLPTTTFVTDRNWWATASH